MPVPPARIRDLGGHPIRPERRVVLYWMTAQRRLRSNFALDHAADWARRLGRPLVILEALRCGYRWANDRLHGFVIDGMAAHAREAAAAGVTYLPYLEPAPGAGRGLLRALAGESCVIVADDFPAFFLPRMLDAAAARLDVRLEAVDSNGLLPMRAADRMFPTALAFRAHLQRTLREHLPAQPSASPLRDLPAGAVLPASIAERWPTLGSDELRQPARLLPSLPIDHTVPPTLTGGGVAARAALARFIDEALPHYVRDHGQPECRGTSGLSPYLHFGHISAHEVFAAVMTAERWTSRRLGTGARGAREGWWGVSAGAQAFLDQLVTWREIGFNACVARPDDYDRFGSLPEWARRTLDAHRRDPRPVTYDVPTLAAAGTYDEVWNAAQRQLVRDGWMHNYLRMLWGKKILEWSPTPEAALDAMIEIMNRFAIDGRDPNSYSGYAWTLGRYDRPWGPKRPIFGTIRYMSSANTRRKLRLTRFLRDYGPGGTTLFDPARPAG